jgi:hypothetical protein
VHPLPLREIPVPVIKYVTSKYGHVSSQMHSLRCDGKWLRFHKRNLQNTRFENGNVQVP